MHDTSVAFFLFSALLQFCAIQESKTGTMVLGRGIYVQQFDIVSVYFLRPFKKTLQPLLSIIFIYLQLSMIRLIDGDSYDHGYHFNADNYDDD